MKVCCRCKIEKPLEDFNKSKNDFQRHCRSCAKQYYKENSERHKENVKIRKLKHRQPLQDWVWYYLKDHPCVDCGETNPIVLEFDHLSDKVASVSELIRSTTKLETIIDEITKCEVRCANCHAIVTAQRHNSWRWMRHTR